MFIPIVGVQSTQSKSLFNFCTCGVSFAKLFLKLKKIFSCWRDFVVNPMKLDIPDDVNEYWLIELHKDYIHGAMHAFWRNTMYEVVMCHCMWSIEKQCQNSELSYLPDCFIRIIICLWFYLSYNNGVVSDSGLLQSMMLSKVSSVSKMQNFKLMKWVVRYSTCHG